MKRIVGTVLILAMAFALSVSMAEETATLKVGDYFFFGHYEQDNNLDNGKEPIEWRVLKAEGNELLAISRYALDSQPYNEKGGRARWNKASLRTWLSNDFYNAAFSKKEKQAIVTKVIENWKENDTDTDPVTLLSCDEAKKLFADHPDRMCLPTAYTVAQGVRLSTKYRRADVSDGPNNVDWWLRTHSWESNARGAYVAGSGGVMTCGGNSNGIASNKRIAVRPAIYLNAELLNH